MWYNIDNEKTQKVGLTNEQLIQFYIRNCDGYSQSTILKEECAELIVALSHFERNRKGSFNEILEELSHVLISCFAFIICADIPVEELTAEVDKKYNKYHF